MKKVWVLYNTEMWEKFNFYGMRAIFSLFMVHFLGLSEASAAIYYGAFLALSYLTPIAGGMLADRIFGYNFSVILGAFLLAFAQLFFFVSALELSSFSHVLAIVGAFLVIVGNGFFKPSIMSLLAGSFDSKERLDAAFSNYYFFLNLGVLLGIFIVPYLGDSVSNGVRDISAFKWGFLAAFLAMLLGLLLYLVFASKQFKSINPVAKNSQEGLKFSVKNFIICLVVFFVVFAILSYFSSGVNFVKTFIYPIIYSCGISLACYVMLDKTLSALERKNIATIFVSAIFIVLFWATFEQAGSSLTFIANNQTDREIFGFEIPASMVQMFNPIFVLILSMPFSFLWARLAFKNIEPSNLSKQSFGLMLMALSYAIIAFGVKELGNDMLSIKWFVLLYFVQTCAEMLIAPIGFALVGKLSPKRFLGLIYGIFYLANAAGYALSGTIAALMPPTSDKFIKANELGIDLNAVLNNSELVSQGSIEILKQHNLPTAYPEILGYKIVSLYDFFMLFVVLCAFGGILLFVIAKILKNTEQFKFLKIT